MLKQVGSKYVVSSFSEKNKCNLGGWPVAIGVCRKEVSLILRGLVEEEGGRQSSCVWRLEKESHVILRNFKQYEQSFCICPYFKIVERKCVGVQWKLYSAWDGTTGLAARLFWTHCAMLPPSLYFVLIENASHRRAPQSPWTRPRQTVKKVWTDT